MPPSERTEWINEFTVVHALVGYGLGRLLPGVHILALVVAHLLFERWESTEAGQRFFNGIYGREYLWEEYRGDSWPNTILDTAAFTAGVYWSRRRRHGPPNKK